MSDEEESMSEGFSASEDEWKPSKEARGGESSDDDDSDYEESSHIAALSNKSLAVTTGKKKGESKARSSTKQTTAKKRPGLSLRAKLYNKYRPLPKTFSPPSSAGKNSPKASTSRTNSKNVKTPNESRGRYYKNYNDDERSISSDGSIDDYLVNPEELDIQSSFFNVNTKTATVSPVPDFDFNAGLDNLSDSSSEDVDNNHSDNFHKKEDTKAFDFRNLLESANSLERVKNTLSKHAAEEATSRETGTPSKPLDTNIDTMDVYSLLALGEKQPRSHIDGEDEDDEEDEEEDTANAEKRRHGKGPSKLSKTKSTRVKRHTKTRPPSTVLVGGDTDDSDFEEVAETSDCAGKTAMGASYTSHPHGTLEIHVEMPSQQREKKTRTQQDLEMALKRRLNRDMKDCQLLMHKASLLCHFGRTYFYNRLLNDTILMNKALNLLPSKNSYPPERGTEIKYYQSLVTWFKGVITLTSPNLYPDKKETESKSLAYSNLLKQIEEKQAHSKQNMIFIFIILVRGMGLQCRLVNNMQPLPLKPAQSDLLPLKIRKCDENEGKNTCTKRSNSSIRLSDSQNDDDPSTSSKAKLVKQKCNEKQTMSKIPKQLINMEYEVQKEKLNQANEKGNMSSATSNTVKEKKVSSKCSIDITSKKISDKSKSKTSVKIVKSRVNKHTGGPKISRKYKTDSDDVEPPEDTKSKSKIISSTKDSPASKNEDTSLKGRQQKDEIKKEDDNVSKTEKLENSQKENNLSKRNRKANLARLKSTNAMGDVGCANKKNKLGIDAGSSLIPKIVVKPGMDIGKSTTDDVQATSMRTCVTRSRSKSPQVHISTAFLQSKQYKEKFPRIIQQNNNAPKTKPQLGKSSIDKVKISTHFLSNTVIKTANNRILRSRQKTDETNPTEQNSDSNLKSVHLQIPQMDGAHDGEMLNNTVNAPKKKVVKKKKINKEKQAEDYDGDFEPSPIKKPKIAPALSKKDRRVLSTDDEENRGPEQSKLSKATAGDMWVEVWSDVEEQWVCVDLFKGKIHCVDIIRKSASSNLAYIFAFGNDLSVKDVTARYCPNWTNIVRKSRIDKAWLDIALSKYRGHTTKRDIIEDQELRRLHESKPMPTAIGDYKNHPFYALERHLLKFEALYPPSAPTLGYIRGEAVYSRDCVHTLHAREIWLKQARVVKLGEKPYKIVKARPKWDRITQTVIKDQPLEIFGYWQTEEYDPPTAENGIVPRNAYGNVELFKPTMLPKKCVHIRLPGLNRICKKLGVDCANAVIGFDFHQGVCHPTFDGFVVCEEFQDQVTAAWYQDQEDQERKEQEKYETRVYGNWKKLIRGLLIRERLKNKYNF